jgi:hypothetical protein
MTTASHNHLGAEGSSGPSHRNLWICEGAVVETLTISAVAELPPGVAEEGEIKQLAPAGTPLQVNNTDWLNPPKAVMLSEY